ncbi:MAG: pyruvate kinase [Clostridia bacterium]|jgi:pyruvate kinase|nr:pyruvate kinase [Clostridia bacterium]
MIKTKIVCTIGPASEDRDVLKNIILSGMTAARINFSHGSHEEHLPKIKLIKELRSELDKPVPLILDTKGPEIRTGMMKDGNVILKRGSRVIITTEDKECTEEVISVSHKDLALDLKVGNKILIDDGLIELDVIDIVGNDIECIVLNEGELGSRKGVNLPDVKVSLPAITEKDIEDIKFGIEQEFDYIAASFIRTAEDVKQIKHILKENGGEYIKIISKIENREGVDNLDSILEISDGLMVARGDLGVEIPTEEVPVVQKMMIRKANEVGKPVITATQMLDSMIRNPRPTRAEATDVANAIFDGTDAVMLSGETAKGDYPIQAVKTMAAIARKAETTELHLSKCDIAHKINITHAIGKAATKAASDLNAKAILTVTKSGTTSRIISKYRPACPIVAFTNDEHVCRQLNLVWGCRPNLIEIDEAFEEFFEKAVDRSKHLGLIADEDLIVLTAGVPLATEGTTNLMEIKKV